MTGERDEFDRLLKKAAELRGHLCLGLSLGVRMGLMGLQLLRLEDHKSREHLVVFVENDRCLVDGIQVSTGCSAGSRRLKIFEYGKSAATFVDGRTGKGFRVSTKRSLAKDAADHTVKDTLARQGEVVNKSSKMGREMMMNAFLKMTPEELFGIQEVRVSLATTFLSARSPMVRCSVCGEEIKDGRGEIQGNVTLCKACAHGAYYESL